MTCMPLPARGPAVHELDLPLPPAAMPRWQGRRPLKRWRYIGVFGPELQLCVGDARIGPVPVRWWAIAEPGRPLREGREKLGNTSVHVGPDGELKGVYRKIHMFDVVVAGQEYRESESEEPGEEIVLSETADGVPLGMTVCYDLRFPELFRILAVQGARVIALPSAFTKVTGEAHWEVLVRARAIENQAFVVAPDQVGAHPPDKRSYGGSMIVDPWGVVLARAGEGEAVVAADLDLARQDEVRDQLPSLANRVPAAYRWPEEVRA